MNESNATTRPRYRWPRFVLAAFVAFVVLAVIWMSVAVHRLREQKSFSEPASSNSTTPASNR